MSISTEYPDGIKAYDKYELLTTVFFPKNDVRCKWCKFCIYNRNTTSQMCAVTGDTLYYPDKGVGIYCPLVEINEE